MPANTSKRGARKSGARKRRETPPVSQLRLVLAIILLALFIGALLLLNTIETPATTQATVAGSQASDGDAYNDDQYTFYSKLKSFKVAASSDAGYSSADDEPFHYLIQAGAFKTDEQAQRRLVELKLLGLEPEVDTVTNSSGTRWHRVRLGPFTSRSKLAGARALILENGMEAIVMKPRSG